MIFSVLLLITGLTLSAVAVYYSVIGLTAIFAASFWPIVVMGTTLEISKLVAAAWLKAYWDVIPSAMKWYMTSAVVILMLITSMGIFGFLSKAHTDQAVPLGDTASQVAFIDEKINNERETIANARSLIKQLDDAVLGIQSGEGREIRQRDGSVRVQSASEYALQVRRAQATDRAALTKTIEEAQARVVKLQEEKSPIASKLRAVEAEVGPIKYIAKLIYGDNPDQNLLERAVVWVIIIIVLVFDPMAVLLLLGSLMTWQWFKEEKMFQEEMSSDVYEMNHLRDHKDFPEPVESGYVYGSWPFKVEDPVKVEDPEPKDSSVAPEPEHSVEEQPQEQESPTEPETAQEFDTAAHAKTYVEDKDIVDEVGVEQWNRMLEKAEEEVQREREQQRIKPDFTEVIEPESLKKKTTYMIKEQNQQVKKLREE
jgi:hypothetical protein